MSELILTEQLENELAITDASGGAEPLTYRDFTRVSKPNELSAGWSWDSPFGEYNAGNELEGVYLGYSPDEYALWPYAGSGGGSGKASPPYLRSYDGIVGFKSGDDIGDLDLDKIESAANGDGTYRWQEIEYCQWKERNGRRIQPRARKFKFVFLLFLKNQLPELLAVNLPATSHRSFSEWKHHRRPGEVTAKLGLAETMGSVRKYVIVKPVTGEVLPQDIRSGIARTYISRMTSLFAQRTPPEPIRKAKETVDVVPF